MFEFLYSQTTEPGAWSLNTHVLRINEYQTVSCGCSCVFQVVNMLNNSFAMCCVSCTRGCSFLTKGFGWWNRIDLSVKIIKKEKRYVIVISYQGKKMRSYTSRVGESHLFDLVIQHNFLYAWLPKGFLAESLQYTGENSKQCACSLAADKL